MQAKYLKIPSMLILYLMAKMLELGGLENHMEMWQELCFPEALVKVYMEHNTPLEIYF